MTTIVASHGSDTHVRDSHPNRNYAGGTTIRLQSTHRYGFVHIPVTDVRGRTVLSATLTGHVRSGFAAQTVTVNAVSDSWSAGKTTWNRQPTVGAGISTSLGALSDGDAADLDVTTLLQAVADGTAYRGLRLSTDATTADVSNWYAFDAAEPSWTLTVELSDAPEQPSDLRPNLGAVGAAAPVLAWSYTDLGGDSSEQGGFRVQVDPAADEVSPAFDTGWITSGDPQYDLSSGSFTPLTSGASTQWRVMTKDASGNESEWSDWVPFTYVPYPTLTMDSPTGGVIGDSTPDVVFHLTGETLTQWRVRVEDTAGTVLWNSGLTDGTPSVTVPKRNDDGVRVIKRDDASYVIRVRAWGDVARADAVGLPAYVEQTVTVDFDEDAGVETPSAFTVTRFAAGDPRTTFSWTMTLEPDAILVLDAGEVVARLDSDDWTLSAGVYAWTDQALVQPFVDHTFTLRAVSSGARSPASTEVDYRLVVDSVWLVPVDMDPIRLDTKAGIDQFVVQDRAAIFKPINTGETVRVVSAFEGISGTFPGMLSDRQDQDAAVARLGALRADVYATPRLVWGVSIPVSLGNIKVFPAADFTDAQRVWNVSFDFTQVGD